MTKKKAKTLTEDDFITIDGALHMKKDCVEVKYTEYNELDEFVHEEIKYFSKQSAPKYDEMRNIVEGLMKGCKMFYKDGVQVEKDGSPYGYMKKQDIDFCDCNTEQHTRELRGDKIQEHLDNPLAISSLSNGIIEDVKKTTWRMKIFNFFADGALTINKVD